VLKLVVIPWLDWVAVLPLAASFIFFLIRGREAKSVLAELYPGKQSTISNPGAFIAIAIQLDYFVCGI